MSKFTELLEAQIGNEFNASQQYVAMAVYFDSEDLPQLARHFYAQSVEERNHAMMLVQYMLDRDLPVRIPGIAAVKNDFSDVVEPIALALAQEKQVTSQIEALFAAARAEGDALGEQFMLWFLKEQVEEVASMSTLLTVARRADNLFDLENFMARERVGDGGEDSGAPEAAGGAL
ncbi:MULTISPECIES: ferritin [Arthrobacter]|uniref:Ferritin n=1 Tax=Arthrobacter caoxuetaonis TaxID=2886935 RepID=A0A9X1MBW1_9MICC|nr:MULTISPECIES: ferritin [Arthrobacter]MCC3281239.1 ferritin [Arthrobacter caoxuetaonis]MCC3296510.1 ferritin [Arthrobacter caoxuetaonis]MCC9192586.1 ferritin [Arthrobacter sp. zg-Y916]USQ56657.1 ferritin [Arthrobacter caoxuetaonis]